MAKKLNIETKKTNKFEIVIQVRDHAGNPTGKTKSFITDNSEELETWYNRNAGNKKQKNTKK